MHNECGRSVVCPDTTAGSSFLQESTYIVTGSTGVCGDGRVISYLVILNTAVSQLMSIIRKVINELHQRSVSINSVITATLLFRQADCNMAVWLTASLVLGMRGDGLLTDSEQGFPRKDIETQFSMTQVDRSRQQRFEK